VLARLDTDKLEANVEHARASLTARQAALIEAEVTLDEKKEAYDRALRLSDQGISSQEVLLGSKAAYERAVAALDTAKANIKVAEADCGSPGRIWKRPASARRSTASCSTGRSRSARSSPPRCRRRCCSRWPRTCRT
jgi:multidrug resistance efflux pump